MIKYICDICKKEVQDECYLKTKKIITEVEVTEENFSTSCKTIDLCEECLYEFEKQMAIAEKNIITEMMKI
ncbi:hypothetical protein [Clostridium sporogenes]|uniref:hypothetical protein n=1 Tax=Clostridium sporogenes TaxID=1509 RepID=UPI0013D2E651|nr:hypothetical protein [Clostridium sporogenes]NFP92388.1 hypothetical protein [Clostridium sporogenes]